MLLTASPVTPPAAAEPRSEPVDAPSDERPLPTDQVVVRFEPGATPDERALEERAGRPVEVVRQLDERSWVVKLDESLELDEASRVADDIEDVDTVAAAEPDGRRTIAATPNDPFYTNQWHYKAVTSTNYGANLPGAWDITTGSSDVVVAVVDTGKLDHQDLVGRYVPGYDFVSDATVANDGDGRDANPDDPGNWITVGESASGIFKGCPVSASSWHGTHVAGTIGAKTDNGVGVAGVDWQARILPVRALGKCFGYDSDIADGIRWAAGLAVPGAPANANPADVINLSLGGSGDCTPTFQTAINQAVAAGATVVVAAGNSNTDAENVAPANCANVITVGSTNQDGDKAYYSNFGSTVEISAPGGDKNVDPMVLSTVNTGSTVPVADAYDEYQGTSMAAPHVAGIVSLMLSQAPNLTNQEILDLLQSSATPFPIGSSCNTSKCGAGIVNAASAVSLTSPVDADGHFTGMTPKRLLDSRNGTGGVSTKWGTGETRELTVRGGSTGVPADATAVVLNVTATQPTANTFLTVWPSGQVRPLASNLNVGPGQTIPNLVTVKVGSSGRVSIYNNLGSTHVIADVVGYYRPGVGSVFTGVTPSRILDSRNGTGGFSTPWGPADTRELVVAGGTTGIPANATAVVMNVTVTQPTGTSFLTVWPAGTGQPVASNLNFTPGQTIPNLVVVKVGTSGRVSIYNNLGSAHVIADVVGYFTDAASESQFAGMTPNRLLDSRVGTGGFSSPWGVGTTRDLTVTGPGTGVPADATAVVLNVTVTQPTGVSYLTVWPTGQEQPTASNLNFTPGQTIPNLVTVKVGSGGRVSVFNNLGSVHVIADVVGYYQ